jgi:NADP-dependent 3-hydroxy acid dehydrogenase YdfG
MNFIRDSCSSGGVGHDLALEFAGRGLRVFATARSTKSLSSLEQKGIETFELDVMSEESIRALKDEIVKRTGGKLDILFNNAGTSMACVPFKSAISSTDQILSQCMKPQQSKPTLLASVACLTPMSLACLIWFQHSLLFC